MPSNNERIPETLDYQETDEMEHDQQIGAKVLSQAHFESSHQPIVESSFNKAIKKGEKLPGKNNERRNLSYLKRLNSLIEKHGNKAEQRLWYASIKDDLLIQYDNIPKSYWNTKKQELRDNGYGNYELTDEYKHEIYEKERELQKESLEKWVNYLGDEHSPYPLWFKVYAWDGMTKMGRYDKTKGKYESRNETTVAPYPEPDAEILVGVFDVINRYYGNDEKQFYTEEGERNIKLEQIVSSGSFPKIFNAIQQDIAPIMEPPEKAEDVHGEWVEYRPGDEDDIARAARGTGWCIGGSASTARQYLTEGTYGQETDYWDDDDYNNKNKDLKSRFILLHLKDPSTGKLSRNAVASIRLNTDGNVAEISGLKGGQALNDSLVPIVEEKTKSLPGGEEFLPKFADKNYLIALDRKMKNNEDLTKEELEFLYEIHRPIETLDTYYVHDPRIKELKAQYGAEYALDKGVDANQLVSKMPTHDIPEHLGTFIGHGVNVDELVSKMSPMFILKHLDMLTNYGANIDFDGLVSGLYHGYGPVIVLKNLDTLNDHGANIDIIIYDLVSRLYCAYRDYEHLDTVISNSIKGLKNETKILVLKRLGTLISHDAEISVDQLASKMPRSYTDKYHDIFLRHDASI